MNTLSDTLKVPDLQVGTGANPANVTGATGAMVTTNKPNGSLHLRQDADTLPEIIHNSAVSKLGLGEAAIECRLSTLTANTANTYITYLPRGAKITGVSRRYTAVPASASGTVVVGITLAGNPILASASETEEGLTNDTMAAHALTGTPANLIAAVAAKVIITITSNNGDMTGGTGGMYYIYYDHN